MKNSKFSKIKISVFQSVRGAAAPLIVVSIIPMIAAMGGAVDLANIYMVQSQMRDAVDNAALAGGRLFKSPDRNSHITNFFNSNLQLLKNNNRLHNLKIETGNIGGKQQLTVTAEVDVKLLIMKFFGPTSYRVKTSATVERGGTGMELVLALDNTYSMTEPDPDGGTRMDALKSGSIQLINTLYGGNETNPNLWIGIIPYTSMVNVGKILKDEETSRGVSYIENMSGYDYDPTSGLGWKGCVDESPTVNTINSASDPNRDSDWTGALDTKELAPGQLGQPLFRPFLSISHQIQEPITDPGVVCKSGVAYTPDKYINGIEGADGYYQPGVPVTSPVPSTCVPHAADDTKIIGYTVVFGNRYVVPSIWPTNSYTAAWWKPVPTSGPSALVYPSDTDPSDGGSPNLYCPQESINLKARTKTDVINYLNKLRAYNFSEGTMSNVAMGWAYRMLTPAPPLVAPVKTSARPKIIILMTDGFLWQDYDVDRRSAYGYPPENKIAVIPPDGSIDIPSWKADRYAALEARLRRWCSNARSEGIRVYTVAFTLPSTDPRSELYRTCATEPGMYYYPQTSSELANSFNEIANSLTNLRLVK
jgi:Flp pilus assembly protein TadG